MLYGLAFSLDDTLQFPFLHYVILQGAARYSIVQVYMLFLLFYESKLSS